jgi:hypothetical protein
VDFTPVAGVSMNNSTSMCAHSAAKCGGFLEQRDDGRI